MRALSFFAVVAVLVGGCRLESSSTGSYGYGGGSTSGELTIDDAHQTGAMGHITAFDGGGDRLESYRDGSSTFVQIDSIGTGWWVMSAISIDQDIDTLVPGTTYSSSAFVTTPGATTQPLSVEVRGCSGPEYTDYTYDDLAQETTVRVEALPSGQRRVHYDCTFVSDGGATQHTVGYFDYTPSSSGSSSSASPDGVAVVGR